MFFHASWCPPCRFYEKQFIAPLEKLAGVKHIERVDAWRDQRVVDKYHVERLPAVVLLDGETIYMNRTGAIDINKVAKWLKGEEHEVYEKTC